VIGLALAFIDAQLQWLAVDDQATKDRRGPCRRAPIGNWSAVVGSSRSIQQAP
jgi:hypothetical protein